MRALTSSTDDSAATSSCAIHFLRLVALGCWSKSVSRAVGSAPSRSAARDAAAGSAPARPLSSQGRLEPCRPRIVSRAFWSVLANCILQQA